MPHENPLAKPKQDYQETIEHIKSESAVGIDAQYTHAIIIEYLKQISQRLDVLENKILKS
jgi:hypothetical protein